MPYGFSIRRKYFACVLSLIMNNCDKSKPVCSLLATTLHYSLPSASLPVAKVIPLLSDMAHSVLGDNVVESHIVQVHSNNNSVSVYTYIPL